jgi:hypothetical protein
MELIVKEITFPEVIEFNYDDLKAEITARTEKYANLVYSEEQMKDAKTDLANLRKFTKALSDERIKVKKECLKAYEPFETKIKELSGIVDNCIGNIDIQVKNFETAEKEAKRAAIEEHFAMIGHPEWLSLEQIFDDKWLNKSVKLSAVYDEIDLKLTGISIDLDTLSNLPEFGFEAEEVYKSTLDMSRAISEGKRLAEIQKRKAEEQQKMNEAIEKVATSAKNTAESIINAVEAMTDAHLQKGWVSFKALLSTEDALALKDFFESRNIKFERI